MITSDVLPLDAFTVERVKVGDQVLALMHADGTIENSKITKLYVFEGNQRKEVENAEARRPHCFFPV